VTTATARPLFRGHYQPRIPGELGFYDLRLPETREAQARLAEEHGIEAFCYWHYWLGNGRRLLETPFERVLESGRPHFPFCLGWANHDWKGVFFGAQRRVLAKQEYPGEDDDRRHFADVLRAFRDKRYLRVHDRPLFLIYRPQDLPDSKRFTDLWRSLAREAGVGDIYFVGEGVLPAERDRFGLNAVSYSRHRHIEQRQTRLNLLRKIVRRISGVSPHLRVYRYEDAMEYFLKPEPLQSGEHPSIVPGWDTTARLGREAVILDGASPELFGKHVAQTIEKVLARGTEREENLIFVKSWNEWAEGNYLEPDRKYGRLFLETLRDSLARTV
jgi:hypothetical protein